MGTRTLTVADIGALGSTAKAADSQLLDGVNGASYARSDAADTISGTHTHTAHVYMQDNKYLYFGTGNDVEFFCNGSHMYMDLNSGIGNWYIRDGNTTRFTFDDAGHFTATGNVTAYSDERLKDNIQKIDGSLDKVLSLNGYSFNRKDMDGEYQIGLLAQEVERVFPEVIHVDKEDVNRIMSVNYGAMVAPLIEAIKEQQGQIDSLKKALEEIS